MPNPISFVHKQVECDNHSKRNLILARLGTESQVVEEVWHVLVVVCNELES